MRCVYWRHCIHFQWRLTEDQNWSILCRSQQLRCLSVHCVDNFVQRFRSTTRIRSSRCRNWCRKAMVCGGQFDSGEVERSFWFAWCIIGLISFAKKHQSVVRQWVASTGYDYWKIAQITNVIWLPTSCPAGLFLLWICHWWTLPNHTHFCRIRGANIE